MKRAIGILQDNAQRRPLILVVDDDSAILDSLEMSLGCYGIDLKLAPNGLTAVSTYKKHKGQIEGALIDVQMPEIDGPAVLDLLRASNPMLRACFMTGYSKYHSTESLQQISGRPVLAKPFVSLDFVALSLWKMVDESNN
jgi:CheY-like chemotaxis protein